MSAESWSSIDRLFENHALLKKIDLSLFSAKVMFLILVKYVVEKDKLSPLLLRIHLMATFVS